MKEPTETNEEYNEHNNRGESSEMKTSLPNLQLGLSGGSLATISNNDKDLIDFSEPEENKQGPEYLNKDTTKQNEPELNRNLPPLKNFCLGVFPNNGILLNTKSGQAIQVLYIYTCNPIFSLKPLC